MTTNASNNENTFSSSADEKTNVLKYVDHHLKCWPQFFQLIKAGKKTHDLRRADDRDFRVGDRLLLEEFDPATKSYSGNSIMVRVTYVTSAEAPCALSDDALNPSYCILSITVI